MSNGTIVGLGTDLSKRVINSRSVTTEDIGIQRLTETYTCTTFSAGLVANSNSGSNLPQIYSIHPEFPNMSCEAVQTSNQTGGLAEITAQYVGFLAGTVRFFWPPDLSPIITGANSLVGEVNNKITPNIRYYPAGERIGGTAFPSDGDWAHYPIIVEIRFIDSVANETSLYSDWRVGQTLMPTEFRGVTIPAPEVAPYFNPPPEVPPGFKGTLYGFLYSGVVLSSLSVNRRGRWFNEIRATFKDRFKFSVYQYV